MSRVRLEAVLCVASLVALESQGQVAPVGPEFRVNSYTTSAQSSSAVAMDAAGTPGRPDQP